MKRVKGFSHMSSAAMKRLESLAILPERDVGTKDMPEWTEEEFARAIRLDGRPFAEVLKLYRVRKTPYNGAN